MRTQIERRYGVSPKALGNREASCASSASPTTHAVGYRNYPLNDSSRNNTLVAWLVFGEGYQNNHHRYPASAQFAHRWFEVDFGFVACMLLSALGIVSINVAGAPRAAEVP
jgi:stearoyl-CoA desaturase (delta-9 desaturase)